MDDRILTAISAETFVQGTIRTHGSIRIDGKVEGNVYDAKNVVIGEAGQVQGDIVAEAVVIGGKVMGNIQSVKLVQILAHGAVMGDIRTKSLHIEDGAVFEGTCTMSKQDGSEAESGKPQEKKNRLVTSLPK
ncbi:MAG: polymer-forming cytoskeletal protein [Elusimicrobiota bacterium]